MNSAKVFVVTGSARGVGRGIALMLAETGATIYLTDRDSRHRTYSDLPGTVEDTAAEVTSRGGVAIPNVIDHSDDAAVAELFTRIAEHHGGVDLVIANAFNGNALPFTQAPFWELPMTHWKNMIDAGLRSHLVTARHAAPLLIKRNGLLVMTGYAMPEASGGHLFYDLAMSGISRIGAAMSHDLAPHDVAVVTVSPGPTSTEAIREAFGNNPLPPGTDSVHHVGRVVTALWEDPAVGTLSGQTVTVAALAQRYRLNEEARG